MERRREERLPIGSHQWKGEGLSTFHGGRKKGNTHRYWGVRNKRGGHLDPQGTQADGTVAVEAAYSSEPLWAGERRTQRAERETRKGKTSPATWTPRNLSSAVAHGWLQKVAGLKPCLLWLQTRGPRTGLVSPEMDKEWQGASLVVKATVGFEELELVSLPWQETDGNKRWSSGFILRGV